MKEDVVCLHVPVVSMVLAVFMSQFLWVLLSVAHVYIPLPVWLGSFLVGCLVALYQQITYVTVDDEKRTLTAHHLRPLLLLKADQTTLVWESIRDIRVRWRGERALKSNREEGVGALFHTERSMIQMSTALQIRYKADSESNRVKTLAVLEFDDLLGLEKPYVSLLHQWNNKIRERIGYREDGDDE